MTEFWRTKKFRELYKTWNEKLKESEFEDAEIDLKGDRALKQKAANSYRQATELERDTRFEYFRILGSLANHSEFKCELHKTIMLKHADGSTIKEIVEAIRLEGITKDRKTVGYIIRRYQHKWGLKHWTPKQMKIKKVIE